MPKPTHPKIEAFYNAMPDDLTLEACADGVTIEFEFKNKQYSINTKVLERPRTSPIQHYYDTLERMVMGTEPKS